MLPAEDGNATGGGCRIYQPGIGDATSVGQRCCQRCSGLLAMVFRAATSVTVGRLLGILHGDGDLLCSHFFCYIVVLEMLPC